MSGFEIFSLIAGIIGVTETIIRANDAIKDLKGLPEAFQEVNKKLPLVEKTLQAAKTDAENASGDEAQALETLLKSCKENTDQLLDIFMKIAKSKGKSVVSVYRILVIKIGKKGRVETLMRGILEDMYTLTTYRVFQTATQSQVGELRTAIQELEQVEPSLPDSDFEEMAGGVNHYGEGHIYNNTGSGTQKNVSRDNYEAARDMHFAYNMQVTYNAKSISDSKATQEIRSQPQVLQAVLEDDQLRAICSALLSKFTPLETINIKTSTMTVMQFDQAISALKPKFPWDPKETFKFHHSPHRLQHCSSTVQLTGSFWLSPKLEVWSSTRGPRLIVVKGTRYAQKLIRHFSTLVIDQLITYKVPVLWALPMPNEEGTRISSMEIPGIDLLKLLALQAINISSETRTEKTISLLYRRFSTAASENDWFDVLGSILVGIGPLVYIVVDTGLLDSDPDRLDGFPWLQFFQTLLHRLSSQFPGPQVKILLLHCRSDAILEPSGQLPPDIVVSAGGSFIPVRRRKTARRNISYLANAEFLKKLDND